MEQYQEAINKLKSQLAKVVQQLNPDSLLKKPYSLPPISYSGEGTIRG
ncbi:MULTISPECIES: hypothetical protein [unclassified Neochlamydia]|nr:MULTISPECIES: hypothetical protein [unclassified Neochlamydia]MBS4167199.1 hypothetical protein [Neochlamydia sp. AcF65]MBS4170480.1 hypothetical protein [Neochlamydia sp. AcF95]